MSTSRFSSSPREISTSLFPITCLTSSFSDPIESPNEMSRLLFSEPEMEEMSENPDKVDASERIDSGNSHLKSVSFSELITVEGDDDRFDFFEDEKDLFDLLVEEDEDDRGEDVEDNIFII